MKHASYWYIVMIIYWVKHKYHKENHQSLIQHQ